MKIKLAILEADRSYLNGIVTTFSARYSDKLQIHSFTDKDITFANLESERIDVLLAHESFDIDPAKLPKRCSFAYLVDASDIETLNGQRAIGKYQKADLIYRQILSLYSEKAGSLSGLKLGEDTTKIVAFQPISGGCGGSTMAAACALRFAAQGMKTLFLDLEKFGTSDLFFSGEGVFSMSDVIYALKSKTVNLALKLESCVKKDPRGVFFYSASSVALDMMELKIDDILRLISELRLTGSYDVIVLDMDFSVDSEWMQVIEQTQSWVWVSDGSDASILKLFRTFQALSIREQNSDHPQLSKLAIIYNKFSNKTSKSMDELGIRLLGGNPRFEHATTDMVLEQVVKKDCFDSVFA